MLKTLIFAACVALCLASEEYKEEPKKAVAPAPVGRYFFYGYYPGKCGKDGIYYRDAFSFVFCSNGNSYVQPCAPGTRNSGYERFSKGTPYSSSDFCDVNLNDYGYGADKGYYGPAYPYGGYYGYDRPYGFPYGYPYGYYY